MQSSKSLARALGVIALVASSPATAQQDVDLEIEVMSAVSTALGLASDTSLDYADDLDTARVRASKSFWCAKEGERELPLLDDAITEKIAAKAVEQLRTGPADRYVLDSPGRVAQLIEVSIASFEMGRTFAMSAAEQATLCAAPNN